MQFGMGCRRVTWFGPAGVVGTNPQVVGPVTTPVSSPNAVAVGAASVEARDEEIFVSVPIAAGAAVVVPHDRGKKKP